MGDPTDVELMLQYRDGSREAFFSLYARYSPKVYGYLKKRIRDTQKTEDVFQEVWAKLHRNRDRFDPKFAVAAWIFVIARSVMLDSLRRFEPLTVPFGENEDGQPSGANSELPDFFELVESLSEREQEVLRLRYEAELDFEEIARRLGLNSGNVRQVISRSVRKLRSLMTPPQEKKS